MSRPATAAELQRVLVDHGVELEKRLNLSTAQLGIPVDGKGLRIRVSVPAGVSPQVPPAMEFDLDGETVSAFLEVAHDYEEARLF